MVALFYLLVISIFYGVLWATAQPDPSSESLLARARRRLIKPRPLI